MASDRFLSSARNGKSTCRHDFTACFLELCEPMRRLTDLRIATKLAVAFAGIVTIIVGLGVATYTELGFLEQGNGWTNHTYQVLQAADAVIAGMVNQETGVRGYLI